MNKSLLKEIINHIFSNFLIVPSDFVNTNNSKSILKKEFLLNEKIKLELNESIIENDLFGCQVEYDHQLIKILVTNCSAYKDIFEFTMLVSIKNMPYYGLYLVYNDIGNEEPLIGSSLNGENWIECNTYLQATFLAGMEQLRDIGLNWGKISDYEKEYKYLINFIDYHHKVYEEK